MIPSGVVQLEKLKQILVLIKARVRMYFILFISLRVIPEIRNNNFYFTY